MKAWLLICLLWASSISAQIVLPVLPQATVSLTLPTQGGTVRNVTSGSAADLQAKINASTCGDTVVLPVATYSGNFTIPSTACSGWIEIESANLGSLPVPGNRVGPSNASNMPIISTPNTAPAFAFLPSSNHWRLMGLEITTSVVTAVDVYALNRLGYMADNSTPVTVTANLPNQIIFDRCYIFGTNSTISTPVVDQGIFANAQAFAMVDSYCDGISDSGADAQCVLGGGGPGPFLIQNNFLQATGENIMFGGFDPAISNMVPGDITIIGNVFQKNTAWCAPSPPYNSCSVSPAYDVKNFLELKNAQRVLADGNVFQTTWQGGQGEAIIIRSVNQSGSCTWCVAQDVTITRNSIAHAPMAVDVAPIEGPVSTNNAVPTQRVLVKNNVATDINSASWGGNGWCFEISANVTPAIMHDITIDHNTCFVNNIAIEVDNNGAGAYVNNFQYTNNLIDYGLYGLFASGGLQGTAALNAWFTNYTYNKDTFLGASCTTSGYPAGTACDTLAGTLFTSYSGSDPNLTGNFQLQAGSAYHNAGTDAKDIGVWDWACLNAITAAALAGTYNSSTPCYDAQSFAYQQLSGSMTLNGGMQVH